MAANDEFPRGCSRATFALAAGVVTITIPAAAIATPVSHVLDSVDISVKEFAALGAATGYVAQVTDGTTVYLQQDLVLTTINGDSAQWSLPGPNLLTLPVGAALVVGISAPAAGVGIIQSASITWHDI